MSLIEKYNINLDFLKKPLNDYNTALITHYAITKNNVYKEGALAEAKEILRKEYNTDNVTNKAAESALQGWLYKFHDIPFPGPVDDEEKFTFIDLFAGIGGFRMAMQAHGGLCVFSSEYDKYAQQTYLTNYGERPFGDITKKET